ncbi:M23 family metallopeptidase [Candidatus Woesearchaeota archaeon]|nr:M23 family metallopeptidase [Candidatus Woesearchaeota archaeon]
MRKEIITLTIIVGIMLLLMASVQALSVKVEEITSSQIQGSLQDEANQRAGQEDIFVLWVTDQKIFAMSITKDAASLMPALLGLRAESKADLEKKIAALLEKKANFQLGAYEDDDEEDYQFYEFDLTWHYLTDKKTAAEKQGGGQETTEPVTPALPTSPGGSSPHFLTWPVKSSPYVNSCFGFRGDLSTISKKVSKNHPGIDIRGKKGDTIVAVAPGIVEVGKGDPTEQTWGRVVVNHGNDLKTEYLHLDTIAVKNGDHVAAGDTLGTLGGRGYGNPDYYAHHLHFGVIDENIDSTEKNAQGIPIVLTSFGKRQFTNPVCYFDPLVRYDYNQGSESCQRTCTTDRICIDGIAKFCQNYYAEQSSLLYIPLGNIENGEQKAKSLFEQMACKQNYKEETQTAPCALPKPEGSCSEAKVLHALETCRENAIKAGKNADKVIGIAERKDLCGSAYLAQGDVIALAEDATNYAHEAGLC